MKCSTVHLFQVSPGKTAQEITLQELDLMKYLDELGLDGVWIAEHHHEIYVGNVPPPPGRHADFPPDTHIGSKNGGAKNCFSYFKQ